jgi:hypothetical protein
MQPLRGICFYKKYAALGDAGAPSESTPTYFYQVEIGWSGLC